MEILQYLRADAYEYVVAGKRQRPIYYKLNAEYRKLPVIKFEKIYVVPYLCKSLIINNVIFMVQNLDSISPSPRISSTRGKKLRNALLFRPDQQKPLLKF